MLKPTQIEAPDSTLAETINKWLENNHGKSLDGRPIWRVVWSSSQTEKRAGEWEDWYGSIFVRRYFGVDEVQKYAMSLDRWVLERLTFHAKNNPIHLELVDAKNGTYEPVFTFQDKNQNFLPLNFKVVQKILKDMLQPVIHLPSDFKREEEEEYAAEVAYFEEEFQDAMRSPLFLSDLGVFYDSTKQKARTP